MTMNQVDEILALRAELPTPGRIWFDMQLRRMDRGEANAINGTLDETYEQWLEKMKGLVAAVESRRLLPAQKPHH